ncbi:MAG: gamma-glutamyltransferase, partial [Woeseia sp.]
MRRLQLNLTLFLSLLLIACSPGETPQNSTTVAPATAAPTTGSAAVAMPDQYGAQVAEDILRAGGNAVDAAVAAGFALAVTYPEAGNIGGGGFMLIQMDGEASFVDYRETAPLAAHRDMYLDENGDVIEGASLVGHRAVG